MGLQPPPPRSGARSAGRTWSGISPPTPRDSGPRRRSAKLVWRSVTGCSLPGRSFRTPATAGLAAHDPPVAARAQADRCANTPARRRATSACRGLARNLLKAWPALWTFAKHPGLEPTNNHAERALRSAVIYRKLSLGSQTPDGETRIARLLSAHTTCRLQRRSLLAYLIDAIGAHSRGHPCPSSPDPASRHPADQLNAYKPHYLQGILGVTPDKKAFSQPLTSSAGSS